jgi:hypothetical protein
MCLALSETWLKNERSIKVWANDTNFSVLTDYDQAMINFNGKGTALLIHKQILPLIQKSSIFVRGYRRGPNDQKVRSGYSSNFKKLFSNFEFKYIHIVSGQGEGYDEVFINFTVKRIMNLFHSFY